MSDTTDIEEFIEELNFDEDLAIKIQFEKNKSVPQIFEEYD